MRQKSISATVDAHVNSAIREYGVPPHLYGISQEKETSKEDDLQGLADRLLHILPTDGGIGVRVTHERPPILPSLPTSFDEMLKPDLRVQGAMESNLLP